MSNAIVNGVGTTLAGAIGASDASCTVGSIVTLGGVTLSPGTEYGLGFASGEIANCQISSGNTLSLDTRGAEGTTATTHTLGEPVELGALTADAVLNGTYGSPSAANLTILSGGTLSVDNLQDGGSGTVTIASTTTLSGPSWSMNTTGTLTLADLSLTNANSFNTAVDAVLGSYDWSEDTAWNSSVAGQIQSYLELTNTQSFTIDGNGNGTFAGLQVGASMTLESGGLYASGNLTVDTGSNGYFVGCQASTFSIAGVGTVVDSVGNGTFASLAIASNSASVDSSGNGTFANVTANGTLTLYNGLTISSGGLAIGGYGSLETDYIAQYSLGSITVESPLTNVGNSFTIDSSGNGTFASLAMLGTIYGIDSSGDGNFNTLSVGGGLYQNSFAIIDQYSNGNFAGVSIQSALTFGASGTMVLPAVDSTSTTGIEGQAGYDFNLHAAYYFNGTAWVAL